MCLNEMYLQYSKFSWFTYNIGTWDWTKKGYPLGLQLIGKTLDEQNILNVAYAFEKNCNFKNEIKSWWL